MSWVAELAKPATPRKVRIGVRPGSEVLSAEASERKRYIEERDGENEALTKFL